MCGGERACVFFSRGKGRTAGAGKGIAGKSGESDGNCRKWLQKGGWLPYVAAAGRDINEGDTKNILEYLINLRK